MSLYTWGYPFLGVLLHFQGEFVDLQILKTRGNTKGANIYGKYSKYGPLGCKSTHQRVLYFYQNDKTCGLWVSLTYKMPNLKFDRGLNALFDDFVEAFFRTVRQLKCQFHTSDRGNKGGQDRQQPQ